LTEIQPTPRKARENISAQSHNTQGNPGKPRETQGNPGKPRETQGDPGNPRETQGDPGRLPTHTK